MKFGWCSIRSFLFYLEWKRKKKDFHPRKEKRISRKDKLRRDKDKSRCTKIWLNEKPPIYSRMSRRRRMNQFIFLTIITFITLSKEWKIGNLWWSPRYKKIHSTDIETMTWSNFNCTTFSYTYSTTYINLNWIKWISCKVHSGLHSRKCNCKA